ncbi:interferon-induced protein 44-like isoform X3 [Tachysurus fulvidraco]|uniref:interferon-induced protein 44-like isoform X3 n=1 Tax=Tachysurus fulvidraco TaxID=1234273 RepID=UPI001FEE0578|nr:interferon-induced protein 44-like isoform X3 [Tachysurus fulvidraco]
MLNLFVCSSEFDQPWRKTPWGEKDKIEHKLRTFKLKRTSAQFVRILVVGEVGAGKSSFINSVNNAFQKRITSGALVDRTGGTSFTKNFEDTCMTDADYRSNPSVEHQTACLVNIVAADKISIMKNGVIDKLKKIRQSATKRNIPQVIIMTRSDLACPLVKQDLRKIYTSKKIKEKMEVCSNTLGIPMNYIFPVKNYHEEIDTDDDMDLLILKALDQIVQNAADLLKEKSPKCGEETE